MFFREEAIRQYQEERRKRREKEDLQREKFRDEIRQKYGIARKPESFESIEKNLQVPVVRFTMMKQNSGKFKRIERKILAMGKQVSKCKVWGERLFIHLVQIWRNNCKVKPIVTIILGFLSPSKSY